MQSDVDQMSYGAAVTFLLCCYVNCC